MDELIFTSVYGDELRTVEISSPSGGGGSFHIMETKPGFKGMFFIGQVVNTMHGWVVYGRRPFTQDDKDAILDRMVEAGLIQRPAIY